MTDLEKRKKVIAERRVRFGISLQELSAAAGVHKDTTARALNGSDARYLTEAVVVALEKALDRLLKKQLEELKKIYQ